MTGPSADGGRPRAVVVVSSSRSGSNLLIRYLRQVPGAAAFGEIFRDDFPRMTAWAQFSKRLGLREDAVGMHAADLTGFWDLVLARILLRKRWVAAKIFYYHRRGDPVWQRFAAPDHRVIHLWRDSTFEQYVSRLRAVSSGQWKGQAGVPGQASASAHEAEPVVFDPDDYREFREQRRRDIEATRDRYSETAGYTEIEYRQLTDPVAMTTAFESIFGERVDLEERLERQSTRSTIDYVSNPEAAAPFVADSISGGFAAG